MAQNLNSDGRDNRGGHKPVTSTKKLFIYRVERSKHEELKAYAIKLNEEAEAERPKRYTVQRGHREKPSDTIEWQDLNLNLSDTEAVDYIADKDFNRPLSDCLIYKIEPLPCNTTEK